MPNQAAPQPYPAPTGQPYPMPSGQPYPTSQGQQLPHPAPSPGPGGPLGPTGPWQQGAPSGASPARRSRGVVPWIVAGIVGVLALAITIAAVSVSVWRAATERIPAQRALPRSPSLPTTAPTPWASATSSALPDPIDTTTAEPATPTPAAPSTTYVPPATIPPVVAGWKTVTNPAYGIAYDVPPSWVLENPEHLFGFEWLKDGAPKDSYNPSDYLRVVTSGAARLDPDQCVAVTGDTTDKTDRAMAGAKGARGAKSLSDEASMKPADWVYAAFTNHQEGPIHMAPAKPFVTKSGLEGMYGRAWSVGAEKVNSCSSDGQAYTFAFNDRSGAPAEWSVVAQTGVPGPPSEKDIMTMMSSVRLYALPQK